MFTFFQKYSFLSFLFPMFSLTIDEGTDGSAGGSTEGEAGSTDEGSTDDISTEDALFKDDQSSEEKKDAETTGPTLEELQEKLKQFDGVDVEKYNALKDLDPAAAKKALSILEKLNANPDLMKQIEETGKKEPTIEEQLKALEEKVNAKDTKAEYDRFMESTESALAEAIKETGIELIAEDGIDEKDTIIRGVIDEFQKDQDKAKSLGLTEGKLSWDDVSRLVKEQTQKLANYRKTILTRSVKKGAITEEGGSQAATQTKDTEPKSDSQRRADLAAEIAQLQNEAKL